MPFLPPNQQRQSTEGQATKQSSIKHNWTLRCSLSTLHVVSTGSHVPVHRTGCLSVFPYSATCNGEQSTAGHGGEACCLRMLSLLRDELVCVHLMVVL